MPEKVKAKPEKKKEKRILPPEVLEEKVDSFGPIVGGGDGDDPWDDVDDQEKEEMVFLSVHRINEALRRRGITPVNRLDLPYEFRILLYLTAVVFGLETLVEAIQKGISSQEELQEFLRSKNPSLAEVVFSSTAERVMEVIEGLEEGSLSVEEALARLPGDLREKATQVAQLLGDSFKPQHLITLLKKEIAGKE